MRQTLRTLRLSDINMIDAMILDTESPEMLLTSPSLPIKPPSLEPPPHTGDAGAPLSALPLSLPDDTARGEPPAPRGPESGAERSEGPAMVRAPWSLSLEENWCLCPIHRGNHKSSNWCVCQKASKNFVESQWRC